MRLCFFGAAESSLSRGLSRQLAQTDEWLTEHQLAFMEERWEAGMVCYEKVYELRRYHLRFMAESLLPLFRQHYPQPPSGARPLYFEREKKLILKTMRPYAYLFPRLYLAGRMETLNLARLFDEYMYLKDLLDHHDAREKGFLFRLLDEGLSGERRSALLERYRRGLRVFEGRWPE